MRKYSPFIIIILVFIPFSDSLVFEFENTEQILAYIPIEKGDTFAIKYTHSIHLSDVIESYEGTRDGQIRQFELQFEDFAIGMPADAGDGEIFEEQDGKYFIKNMNRIFPHFDLRLGKVGANHRLIFHSVEYPLSAYIEPGTRIRIKLRKLNLLQMMKGEDIRDEEGGVLNRGTATGTDGKV